MCIIIACPPGKEIDRHILTNCWNNNDDGAGFMYVKNNKIKIVKELKDFNKFYNLYRKHLPIAMKAESPVVLHFRIATTGSVCLANVHPFVISENAAFAHNGVISIEAEKDRSDTRQFNVEILKGLPKDFYKNKAIMNLLEDKLTGSKIVILDKDRNTYILNRDAGEEDKETGIWYSNSGFKCDRIMQLAQWYDRDLEEAMVTGMGMAHGTEQALDGDIIDDECVFCMQPVDLDKLDTYVLYDDNTVLCNRCSQSFDLHIQNVA